MIHSAAECRNAHTSTVVSCVQFALALQVVLIAPATWSTIVVILTSFHTSPVVESAFTEAAARNR